MDIENGVFRLALTPLTYMTISGKDIFPDIPEAELWTLLVVLALDLRVAYLLDIELCHFKSCPAHGQDLVNQTHRCSRLHLCFKEHHLLSRGANADMLCPCINPKRDFLFIPTTPIEQLQGEWDHSDHFGLALLEQQSCFARLAGH